MDLLRMLLVLVLVLVCSEAQNVTEVRAELGQDATLTCSIRNETDINWYLEVYSQLRASIGHRFATGHVSYSSAEFQTKYLIQENRLVIKNISAEDCRLYFCAEEINHTVDTFRLVSDVPVAPSNNSNQHNQSCTSSSSTCQNEHVMLGSFVLNAVLVSVVTGWMCSYLMRNQENQENQEDQELMGSPQEEETLPLFPAHLLSECIYYRGERHHLKLDRC
ncbi:uncharacterized protein LOC142391297 isoform X2 [Odontesthes bonariensis]|uniref:uncharacterized protein LOC142391297 isoform X2 n=1 Tax=Odontesthes bonariensis TaxID=219752 RepID=UPI003F58C447